MSSKFDDFSEKIAAKIEPIAEKLSEIHIISALSQTMMATLPITVIGSFACLVAMVDLGGWQNFVSAHPALQMSCLMIMGLTLKMITLYVLLILPYIYANKLGMKQALQMIIVVFGAFIILSPQPFPPTAINADWLGHKGMIPAVIVTLVVVRVTKFMLDKKLYIRMPAGVPKFVEDGFAILVPTALIYGVFAVIQFYVAKTEAGCVYQILYDILQIPMQKIGLSYFGNLFVQLSVCLLNFIGLHSSTITGIINPLITATGVEQLTAFQAGQPLPYIITEGFYNMSMIGSSGNALTVTVAVLLFCKAQRYRSVAKASLIPGIFGVVEPIQFGLPIMLNAILLVPYLLVQFFNQTFMYVLIATGIVGRVNGIAVSWTCPPFVGPALVCSTPVRGIIAQAVMFAVDLLIWYPFMKAMDKKALEEEAELENA